MRFTVWVYVIAALIWIMLDSGAAADEAGTAGVTRILYESAFSSSTIGELPVNMRASGLDRGTIEIVADPELPGGKALRIRTIESGVENGLPLSVLGPTFQIGDRDPNVVTIEYHVKWIEGGGTSGQYFYITDTQRGHSIILLHSSGRLRWHARLADPAYNVLALAPLSEGWNYVRVVADRSTGLADVYLNDVDTPVGTGLPFQRPVHSWGDIAIRITHETRNGESRDALYGDIRVTAVD